MNNLENIISKADGPKSAAREVYNWLWKEWHAADGDFEYVLFVARQEVDDE